MRYSSELLFLCGAIVAVSLVHCTAPSLPPFRLSDLTLDAAGENLTCVVTNVSDNTIVPTEVRFFILPVAGDRPTPLAPNPQRVVLSEPIAPSESGAVTIALSDLFFVAPREPFLVSGFHVRTVDVGSTVWTDRAARFSYPDTVLGR